MPEQADDYNKKVLKFYKEKLRGVNGYRNIYMERGDSASVNTNFPASPEKYRDVLKLPKISPRREQSVQMMTIDR